MLFLELTLVLLTCHKHHAPAICVVDDAEICDWRQAPAHVQVNGGYAKWSPGGACGGRVADIAHGDGGRGGSWLAVSRGEGGSWVAASSGEATLSYLVHILLD